ncbi:type I polyketide synthase [Nocardia sp. CDC159]|uniref:Type I polyketide synthase n=1 Tax=Nocardia pulmonis TaxID=2951408 RepID=A0A9X2EAG5_9NOCA|nr:MULTISPECIES: type I polyketide synthase [Nocardia]MCM6776661.1 type I polyketide synthase [Nocardia pulmonis]MCM6789190.1 type I polyketide synthase [Nocardia sp. CDC159]
MASEAELRTYLKRAAQDLHQTRQRLREVEDRAHEPIAIVGMACRYPGGANSPEQLWDLLVEGRDVISGWPTQRGWDSSLYDPDGKREGTTYVREGGFMEVAGFDAGFFGISPLEALSMDPQQRLLLESAWETFERAEIDPDTLRGKDVGVYVGSIATPYGGAPSGDRDGLAPFILTGRTPSVASGRISYVFGFEGPAVTLDTACSSSLVAIHQAVQALRTGECSLALAGGVCVTSTPELLVAFSIMKGLAPDGRCKSYSDSADGTAWGEGVGLVLLERLSDAQAHGHRVLAVVRGSAVNQDGASNGLVAPNGPSQQRVIRAALASAGLSTGDVDVVEGHGTGTALGDPIEAHALLMTYGRGRGNAEPLLLGSIKSNMGHAQAAAGVAGVIKMVMAMQHGLVPPTLHVDTPSSHVDWTAGQVELVTETQQWPHTDRPRRAAVSSFGFSGTNAHLILEQAPEPAPAERDSVEMPSSLAWAISGRSAAALAGQAERLADFVSEHSGSNPADIGYSLAATRAVFEHRAVVVGRTGPELTAGCRAVAAGESAAHTIAGTANVTGKTAFLFPGQGSQWVGMAGDLLSSSPVFAAEMRDCAAAFDEFVDWSLLAVLRGQPDAPGLDRVDVVQPVLFATMVSLAALWRSVGMEPQAVLGHSQGEIAAAYVCGALSLRDAARVVTLRSRVLLAVAGTGGMASIPLPLDQVRARLSARADGIGIAAINGPTSTVVSGAAEDLDKLQAELETEGLRVHRIPVDYASHSEQMERLREPLLDALAEIAPRTSELTFFSTVRGESVDTATLDAEYWYRNIRETVLFQTAVSAAYEAGYRAFVECSAHPVLTVGVRELLDDTSDAERTVVLGTLRRDDGGLERFLLSAAEGWIRGLPVDWRRTYPGHTGTTIPLPTYAFQHQRYWLDTAIGATQYGMVESDHPLLSASLGLAADGGLLLTTKLSSHSHEWLADHAVGDTVLLPGTAFVELCSHAGYLVDCPSLAELVLQAPLVVPASGSVELQVVTGGPQENGDRSVAVFSRYRDAEAVAEAGWTRHATGTLARATDTPPGAELTEWPPAGASPVPIDGLYEGLAEVGYRYGPQFRGLRAVWRRGAEVFAEVELPEPARSGAGRFGVHPALLDAALHAIGASGAVRTEMGSVKLPFVWEGVSLYAVGASSLRVRITVPEPDQVELVLADPRGGPVGLVRRLRFATLSLDALGAKATAALEDGLFELAWTAAPRGATGPEGEWSPFTLSDTADAELSVSSDPDRYLTADGREYVVLRFGPDSAATNAGTIRARVIDLLSTLQRLLAGAIAPDATVVVVTRASVAVHGGERVDDLAGAAAWGLLRSAQNENPGRVVIVDVEDWAAYRAGVVAALHGPGEPQAAVRRGSVFVPRLIRAGADSIGAAERVSGGDWTLRLNGTGTLSGENIVAAELDSPPLAAGQVRVALRAAGLNFRDVLIALGMYPDPDAPLGGEGAGVVIEVGPQVTDLAVGDRVMGLFPGVGSAVVADGRTLVPVPAGWSFEDAAAVPIVFATAYYALVDLADVRAGESILVHAATGGVGMAAVQLARHLGLEVFATASPPKWDALRRMGFDDNHIASSRTDQFEAAFTAATGGRGVDVVLDSLAGELVDAGLRLLPRGGRFVEMGLTDVRDATAIANQYAGVAYRAFILMEAGPQRLGEILRALVALFDEGALRPLPVTHWDVRRAPEAFRHLSQARHIGKNVLTLPRPLDPDGTVLITGGTGGLGALLARHLVSEHGVRHLLLLSRRGPEADSAPELRAELTELGAEVEIVACDVADRAALTRVVADIDGTHPLTAVVHTAGVIEDGLFFTQSRRHIENVFHAKVDAAWNLHEVTSSMNLSAFVLYSSIAGVIGSPGQANYAAANGFLDALAQFRRSRGLPALSLAWGMWAPTTGMTAHLGEVDRARIRARGVVPLSGPEGLALFDAARARGATTLVAARIDTAALRAHTDPDEIPPVLRGLLRAGRRAADGGTGESSKFVASLAGLDPAEQERRILEAIRSHGAAILGHDSPEAIGADQPLLELGFDSLGAVEFRNRLKAATGSKLPATVIFDYPTPAALAKYIRAEVAPADDPAARILAQLDSLVRACAATTLPPQDHGQLTTRLAGLLDTLTPAAAAPVEPVPDTNGATSRKWRDRLRLRSRRNGSRVRILGLRSEFRRRIGRK